MFPFLYLLIFPWQLSSQPVMTVNFAHCSQLEAAANITLCSEVTMHESSPTWKGFRKGTKKKKKNLSSVPLFWSFQIKMCFLHCSRCQLVKLSNKMLNKCKETVSAIFSILFCVQFHPLYLCKTLFRSLMVYIEKYILFRTINNHHT